MNRQSSSGRRVAFFGGSFDPPHLGHLGVARAAQLALGLDSVLFAPVGAQPLKPHGATASFEDRLAMTRLAIADEPSFAVSLADAPKATGEPNFTLDALLSLRAELPPQSELFCLMGADSLAAFRRWHRAAEIPFVASLIVASRPGERLNELATWLPGGLRIEAVARSGDSAAPVPDPVTHSELSVKGTGFSPYVHAAQLEGASAPEGSSSEPSDVHSSSGIEIHRYLLSNATNDLAPVYLLPGLEIEISASQIRPQIFSSLEGNAKERQLLPGSVLEYIRAHKLYR
jgi:nicotinate-nucleotide adenylyltransferase